MAAKVFSIRAGDHRAVPLLAGGRRSKCCVWDLAVSPTDGSLTGQLLVAMPHMADSRFARSVVYLCAHSADGAMGLVVNRLIDSLSFRQPARPDRRRAGRW